jgi:hypothetical protein
LPDFIRAKRRVMSRYNVAGFSVMGALLLTICGCGMGGRPRPRVGCYASNTLGVHFRNATSIGRHNFGSSIGESSGIVYTCRGGHIDLSHLRIASDHSYYLYKFSRKRLASGQREWSFNLSFDPTQFHAFIEYPAGFDSMPDGELEKIIDDVSLELGEYFTWYLTTWHEIITWYGHGTFLVSEFHSAFSWEDSYSNLLGAILGAKAAKAAEGRGTGAYNKAMTTLLEDELIRLGAVPAGQAREASEKMRGKWYSGGVTVEMKLRNLDIGGMDGCVSPAIVPGVCEDATPECLAVPKLEKFKAAGFKLRLEADPPDYIKTKIKRLIFKNADTGPILADEHLQIVMNHIADEARQMRYLVME